MKKQSNSLFTSISTEQAKNLTSIISETLASDFNQATGKIFTEVDLWNIQRQAKNRLQRRFSF